MLLKKVLSISINDLLSSSGIHMFFFRGDGPEWKEFRTLHKHQVPRRHEETMIKSATCHHLSMETTWIMKPLQSLRIFEGRFRFLGSRKRALWQGSRVVWPCFTYKTIDHQLLNFASEDIIESMHLHRIAMQSSFSSKIANLGCNMAICSISFLTKCFRPSSIMRERTSGC